VLCDDQGYSNASLRDNRYDAVLHLVTAADGAPKYYDSLTNEARYETVDDACEKDEALREAYMGHPRFHMISNDFSSFESKI
jgi:hypothetical protein